MPEASGPPGEDAAAAGPPDPAPGLARDVTAMEDGRRITYYSRAASVEPGNRPGTG